jgi:hypothetical protein
LQAYLAPKEITSFKKKRPNVLAKRARAYTQVSEFRILNTGRYKQVNGYWFGKSFTPAD